MLGDINISARTGAVVIAVVRKNKPYPIPGPDFEVLTNDIFVLLGSHAQLDQSLNVLKYGSIDQWRKIFKIVRRVNVCFAILLS